MATLRFYLDVRRPRKSDGKSQLQLQINHGGKTALVPLGVYLLHGEWDAVSQSVTAACPVRTRLDITLRRMRLDADVAMLDIARDLDARGIAGRLTEVLFPERVRKPEPRKPTVVEVARRYMEMKTEANTRRSYMSLVVWLEGFRPEATLDDVGREWLTGLTAAMSRSCSTNGIAVYMRNLRAVFNFAIDEGLTQNYPFRKFKIKTVRTAKRSLPVELLREILTCEVEGWQEPYRDFFKLSFLLIGTNAKDILELPTDAYSDGRIVFNRSKTKKLYSIKVEPEAAELIGRYRGERRLVSWLEGRVDHLQFIRQCNHALKLIGAVKRGGSRYGKREVEALCPTLTTYYARHSWATIAASLDIPKETIAAALGHGGNSVTDIYIDFDRRKVDEANRRVIDLVLGGDGVSKSR